MEIQLVKYILKIASYLSKLNDFVLEFSNLNILEFAILKEFSKAQVFVYSTHKSIFTNRALTKFFKNI